MRKAILVIAAAVALAACARDPFPTLQSRFDALKGQPVQSLVDKLGAPEEKNQNGDEATYVWYHVNNSGPQYQADFAICTIKAYVGKDGRITGFFYAGDNAGCGRYAHRLDEDFKAPRHLLGL